MILDYSGGDRPCLVYTAANRYLINGNYLSFAVLRTGDYLCVVSEYEDPSIGDPGTRLQCSFNGAVYLFESRSDWKPMVCFIPYQPEVYPRIRVESKAGISNSMQVSGTGASYFTLNYSLCDIPPYISFSPELYADYTNTLTIRQSAMDSGRIGGVYSLALYLRAPGESEFTKTTLLSTTTEMECTCTLEDVVGYEWYMVLNYRTYIEAEWMNSYNNYVTVTQITTPVQKITRSGSAPLTPSSLTAGILLAGSKVNVSWAAVYDDLIPVSDYTLERSVDGIRFTALYTGTSLQYPDTVPEDADYIWYRLRTNGTDGTFSAWYTTDALPVVKSNIYIGTAAGIRAVSAVYIGRHRASPLGIVG